MPTVQVHSHFHPLTMLGVSFFKTKTSTGTQLFYLKDETSVETLDVAALKVTYALKEVLVYFLSLLVSNYIL